MAIVKSNQKEFSIAEDKIKSVVIEPVIELLSSFYFVLLDELFETALVPGESSEFTTPSFCPEGNTIAYIDFVGSITGVVAIAADSKVFAQCFDIPCEGDIRNAIESPLKEVMNTVAGKCLSLMTKQYLAITMLTPRIISGSVSYPKIKCFCKTVATDYGDISFYYSVDTMKLEMVRALEKLEATESKTQEVLKTLGGLHTRLESAQQHIISEISDTMSKMTEIEKYFSVNDLDDSMPEEDRRRIPIAALVNTKDVMTARLGDTIHYLTIFKNMLMSDLQVRKITEGSRHLEVSLSGFVGDDADYRFMHEVSEGKLIISTKNIMNHTEGGVQVWINHISRIPTAVEISFIESSPEFLNMAIDHPNIVGHGSVVSISAHYHCKGCHSKDEVVFYLDNDFVDQVIPTVVCVCGQEMNLWDGCSQDSIAAYIDNLNAKKNALLANNAPNRDQHTPRLS